MDIVIHHPVHNQEVPVELRRTRHDTTSLIASGIFLRCSHVALGVNGVVKLPVHDTSTCDADFEHIRMRQGVGGHKATKAPTFNRNTLWIGVAESVERLQAILDVLQLAHPELSPAGGAGCIATRVGRAVVTHPDSDALLSKILMQDLTIYARPSITCRRGIRAGVHRTVNRHAHPRFPGWRKEERPFKDIAIPCLDLNKLRDS